LRRQLHGKKSMAGTGCGGITGSDTHVLLLGYAVQAVRIENQVLGEAVVEQAKAAAQHGFRRALSSSANAPGKAEPGRPVGMIVNRVLRFKAQAAAQREVGTHLPVILHVQPGPPRDRHGGRRAAGRRSSVNWLGVGRAAADPPWRSPRKGVGAVESGAGQY
jgi:hypothetical protein